MRVGIVGYSGQPFDQAIALQLIQAAFDGLSVAHDPPITIVSGLTNVGIPAIAYTEAVKRGWRTVGIACHKALEYDCFPVDQQIILGDQWGDESSTFLSQIDLLIRIGGGTQAQVETQLAKAAGKAVVEFDLPTLAQVTGGVRR